MRMLIKSTPGRSELPFIENSSELCAVFQDQTLRLKTTHASFADYSNTEHNHRIIIFYLIFHYLSYVFISN